MTLPYDRFLIKMLPPVLLDGAFSLLRRGLIVIAQPRNGNQDCWSGATSGLETRMIALCG